MIDSQTEALYGTLPFNRTTMAKTIKKIGDAQAKGIILKFFYDLPSTEEADRALELAICGAPVALQASLNDVEGTTNALEAKFKVTDVPIPMAPELFSGEKALMPLRRFTRCAKAVGFVDSTETELPLVEVYQGSAAKSLFLVALEMASDTTAKIDSSGAVILGEKRLDVMHRINFPATNSLSYIPLHEVLNEDSKTWQPKVRNSVVIVGYDGKKIHSIDTPIGPLGAHRFFIAGLLSLSNSFAQAQGQK